MASYSYDTWGKLTSASESIPDANGWTNPYRYDGRDGVRYDAADGLYWMSVRAYDPTIGRFISHDPLGRAPLFFADQPYAYAGNDPVSNVDPSGQHLAGASNSQVKQQAKKQASKTRIVTRNGPPPCNAKCYKDFVVKVLVAYYTHEALLGEASDAATNIKWDFLAAGIDAALFFTGDDAALVGLIADGAALLADFADWRRYEIELDGGDSSSLTTLREIAGVLHAISLAINAAYLFGVFAFGLADLGQLIKQGAQKVIKWIADLVSSGKVVSDTWTQLLRNGESSSSLHAALERESLAGLLDQCRALKQNC